MSAYRLAIEQTTRAIDERARYYRNLIVVVVVVILGSMIWTAFLWNWIPLLGFLVLFPICGMYFFLDGRLLQSWRSQLLEPWCQRELDLLAFRPAIEAVPGLPSDSLCSMLATLPFAGDLVGEQRLSSSCREAVAAVIATIHACRSDAMAVKVLAYTMAGCSILGAAIVWSWQPLLCFPACLSIFLLQPWGRTWRLNKLKRLLRTTQQQSDFNQGLCKELVMNLSCEPLSASEKNALLATLEGKAV